MRYSARKTIITAIFFFFMISGILMAAMPLMAQSTRVVTLKGAHDAELSMAVIGTKPVTLASLMVTSEELPDAPNANSIDSGDGTASPDSIGKAHKRSWQGAPPAARGGPFGVDRQVADRNYWLITSGMFAVSIANVQATHDCLAAQTCSWVPSAFTRRRNMLAAGLSADAGIAYLSYYMKKKHSSLWFVPEAIVTGVNAFVCIHDARRAME